MPAIAATAPGKIILFGEHAVVYGRPAIAAPVNQVKARAVVMAKPDAPAGEILLQAPDIGLQARLSDLPQKHPLAFTVRSVLAELGIARAPACIVRVTSTIPRAAGLGSGAAVSVATIRAFSTFLGHPLADVRVSALAYEVEKLHHGTPSGIDNTVVTYALPVFFQRDQPIEILQLPVPFTVVVGDTGIQCPTAISVGDVRRAWQAETAHYEALFDAVGEIVRQARVMIEDGVPEGLGELMNTNHIYLQQIGVSAPELDRLVQVAREAGASGAKISGGGRGGNMIALATPESAPTVAYALREAGAVRTIVTRVETFG